MMVPVTWVSDDTLMFPPKGKPQGEFIRRSVEPNKLTWRSYLISKILKERGTWSECNRFFNMPDSSDYIEESDEENQTQSPSPVRKRLPSPDTVAVITPTSPVRVMTPNFRSTSPVRGATPCHPSSAPTGSIIRKRLPLNEDSFHELEMKDFQYRTFMRLQSIMNVQKEILRKLETMESVQPSHHPCHLSVMMTMAEFDINETKMENKDENDIMISRLKSIGLIKSNINETVKNWLDELMSLELQSLFNRDGRSRKGSTQKRGFGHTKLYACMKDAIVSSNTFTALDFKEAIGDVLKRATKRKSSSNIIETEDVAL